MKRAHIIRAALGVVLAGAGLVWMNSLAALQIASVLIYSGIVLAGFGVVAFLLPPKWSGFRRRIHGLFAGLASGSVLMTAGWFWPAHSHTIAFSGTRLDSLMPRYDFHERHEITVHASAARVREAFDRVSFADIGVMQTLGRIRAIAMGQLRAPAPQATPPALPIVQMIRSPRSGFFPLEDTPTEFVFGLAGEPWNNRGVRLRPDEFRDWAPPGRVKIAANFLIEDTGGATSRVITETRVLATDDAARRKMARYWALIYPGSGMIRRDLLRAIRDRAEAR
jgi:hypothetical protein